MQQDHSKQAGLLGYIAGFFDGEGNIGSGMNSGKTRNSFFLKMSFSQADQATLEAVRQRIFDATRIETGLLQGHSGHNQLSVRPQYVLSYQGGKAYALAQALLPYVIAKQAHLQWIIETWEGRWLNDVVHDRDFLQQQHDNRPGRRAAATTKRESTHEE